MKKKQLKEELELANTTLELSMVALRKLDEVLQEAKAQGFVPKNLNDKTEPQAGDKIVESEHPDYVCIKDFDFVFKAKNGQTLRYCKDTSNYGRPYYFNVDDMNSGIYPFSLFKANPTHFQKVEPKKETPLSDLNKEVQEELENKSAHDYRDKNDLSCNQPEKNKDESYLIQAKEAVDMFMPLVNGWVKCQPFAEGSKIFEHEGNGHIDQSFWKWNIVNYRKAAINCAIQHFELIQKQGGWLTHIDTVQIIGELQKMLSEC